MRNGAEAFIAVSESMIQQIRETQMEAVEQAANLITECIVADGVLFTIGTGHSYYLAAESFARAGGLWPVQVIGSGSLAMIDGSARSGRMERLEGLAACVLPDYDMRAGDVIMVISNSGRNAVPVEAALYARERGLKVIALTNVAHSMAEVPHHSTGKRLSEVADVVLDNCGVHGDAAVEVAGLAYRVGPTSTVTGALLIQAVVTQVIANLLERGIQPPVLISGNVDVPNRDQYYRAFAAKARPIKHR
jgi:uncharacterized phosphosugar-binding protein